MRFSSKKKRSGFKTRPLIVKKEPPPLYYLSQRMTFWVAVLSLVAFVTGNMLGQHGWQVFWKSVLGGFDDSLIVYTGTVPPVARVPDYTRWSQYGGSPQVHTFREVPADLLIPLPAYDVSKVQKGSESLFYSVGYMGSYATGSDGDGAHPGVDIRVPVGTPVQAIANGIVTEVRNEPSGYGEFIVVRHPHVPDPANPGKLITLYSCYAHLSEQEVSEGETIRKGEEIGLSGQTGDATGPHLHFQIDRDTDASGKTVLFHPYWPFSTADAKAAGLSYTQAVDSTVFQAQGFSATVSPMLYVQAQYAPVTVVVNSVSAESSSKMTPEQIRAQRIATRLAAHKTTTIVAAADTSSADLKSASSSSSVSSANVAASPAVAEVSETLPPPSAVDPAPVPAKGFSGIAIDAPSTFNGRKWETVSIQLLDADGHPISSVPTGDLYMRTAFGKADFRPAILSPLDFTGGRAEVEMLPFGHTTVIIQIQPQGIMSKPVKYQN